MIILENITHNYASEAQENFSYLQTVYCYGSFAGASVNLQGSPNGTEWFDLVTFNSKEVIGIGLSVRYLRGVVSGATASTNVNLLVE
jgi:hypothetical protein